MTPETEKKPFERQARWREKNPLKRWAHVATASALRYGLLDRKPCEICGAEPTDAHHADYSKPMQVRWLCRKHHKAEHARLKAEEV